MLRSQSNVLQQTEGGHHRVQKLQSGESCDSQIELCSQDPDSKLHTQHTNTHIKNKIKIIQGILKTNKHSPKHQGKVRERKEAEQIQREQSETAL